MRRATHGYSWRVAAPEDSYSIYGRLDPIAEYYPGFARWFFDVVMVGVRDESRQIFLCQNEAKILGIAIAKKTKSERKFCTLWVDEKFRTNRIASVLSTMVFKWLETNKPLFTVPEERLDEFRPLLNGWEFTSAKKKHEIYRAGKYEYVFNGSVHPKLVTKGVDQGSLHPVNVSRFYSSEYRS